MVVLDQVAQSVALIEIGLAEDPPWLSRRRRRAALAVNVDGDLACTVFMHRYNSGALEQRIHVLTRRGGTWVSVGGHQSNVDEDRLSDRPAAATLGGLIYVVATGAVQTNADRAFPWPALYSHYALLRAAREITTAAFRALATATSSRSGTPDTRRAWWRTETTTARGSPFPYAPSAHRTAHNVGEVLTNHTGGGEALPPLRPGGWTENRRLRDFRR